MNLEVYLLAGRSLQGVLSEKKEQTDFTEIKFILFMCVFVCVCEIQMKMQRGRADAHMPPCPQWLPLEANRIQ